MQIETRFPNELSAEELTAWYGLIRQYPQFGSPFFHPEYTRELGKVRDRVEVAVLSEQGRPVGFLPYERHERNVARPLGTKLCDFQGMIAAPRQQCTVDQLLDGAGLSVWHFDHLLDNNSSFAAGALRIEESPFMDLTQGYDTYIADRKKSGTAQITQTMRKRRKLERERGPLEFRWHDSDDDAWENLLQWKSQQRARTRTVDILQRDWVREFLNRVSDLHGDGLHGAMSTLRIDGRLVALHLGMHTDSTLHHWFPTYDREFYKYSPGLILLLEMAQACVDRRISRIDLGKGGEDYKTSFATGVTRVLTGVADLRPVRRAARAGCHLVQQWVKDSPLRGPAKIPKRVMQKLQNRRLMK